MVRVFIVDDHKILAQALLDHLNSKEHIECIGMVHSGEEALEKIPRLQPDVVLLE